MVMLLEELIDSWFVGGRVVKDGYLHGFWVGMGVGEMSIPHFLYAKDIINFVLLSH